jgi:Putative peptidoglycan binding domain
MADLYRFGTRSEAIRALQQALAARGFYADAIDAIFGRNTRAGVDAARAALGLQAGGVDSALLARLGLELAPNTITDFFAKLLLGRAAALLVSQLKGRLPMSFLAGYRTYIVAAAMLLTGLAGLLGVDLPSFTGQAPGNLVMEALAFFFLRQGLKIDSKG